MLSRLLWGMGGMLGINVIRSGAANDESSVGKGLDCLAPLNSQREKLP